MGVSTNGQICYGILFEESYEFPWDSDEWDGDIETWWLYEVCGYQNPFELRDESGHYLDDARPLKERINEYYDTQQAFKEKCPVLPVVSVNCFSYAYPVYILAAPSSVMVARRGYPKEIGALTVAEADRELLIAFCNDYDIETNGEPKWWLSSLWC